MLTQEQSDGYLRARREIITQQYARLNPPQLEAVFTTKGALLLLAGAGSGKTAVLTTRIANLVTFGSACESNEIPSYITGEDVEFLTSYLPSNQPLPARVVNLCALNPVAPWNILAITFTNKAATELKHRLHGLLGDKANDIWASTFHSACTRILRRDIDKLGLSTHFTIYDTADSLSVIKSTLKALDLSEKETSPRAILSEISRAKGQMLLAKDYVGFANEKGDPFLKKVARVYTRYEKTLWDAAALDFDDIILHTVRLLQSNQEVLHHYQQKFHYVLIDEYQDTNHLQYQLATLLAGGHGNFCVVGDDDQSIYGFRGATIENILSFEQQYKGCKVIRLEKNYRSTQTILEVANAVISNNVTRKGKTLWTDGAVGAPVTHFTAGNDSAEADYVSTKLLELRATGAKWNECAILYRTNVQSNQMENACKRNGIPYRIVGGTRFYDRAEIKDMVAYLTVIDNPFDDLRLTRIINTPARAIGGKTLEKVQDIAYAEDTTIFSIIDNIAIFPDLAKVAGKFQKFTGLMTELVGLSSTTPLPEFYEMVLRKTGYLAMLEEKNTDENVARLQHVWELRRSIEEYCERCESEDATPSLSGFLDEIALYTTLDDQNDEDDYVTMMTLHSAKGLEFPHVFLVGMEDGLFPSSRALYTDAEMEEERRLCYVGMTRAMVTLYLTSAKSRMLYGRTMDAKPSRFLAEVPEKFLIREGAPTTTQRTTPSSSSPSYSNPYAKPAPAKVDLPSFSIGDRVKHKAFGDGSIAKLSPMPGDMLVELALDSGEVKKLLLKSAGKFLTKL
ncbi:MAG: UvrD-helicase domain-containing protein [Eubacteriales bacterium]